LSGAAAPSSIAAPSVPLRRPAPPACNPPTGPSFPLVQAADELGEHAASEHHEGPAPDRHPPGGEPPAVFKGIGGGRTATSPRHSPGGLATLARTGALSYLRYSRDVFC
jgi:hypothetical protein